MDQGVTFHEARARSIERAVAEIVDDACSPWFDLRAFQRCETARRAEDK